MYALVNGFMYILSLMPWRLMYVLSDIIYFILFYLFGYRKKVVFQNLSIAFPEKTDAEKWAIAKKFYRGLIDTFLETIKLISVSKEELNKRFVCNYEVVNNLYSSGQNVQLHAAHFFNWEFANLGFSANLQYPLVGVYQTLTNPHVDKVLYNMRKKFGTILISSNEFRNKFIAHAKGNRYTLALAADQNPGRLNNAFWLPFFGKMAPFANGPERGATSQNTAIVFVSLYKIKRGYYQCHFELYTTTPKALEKGKITLDYRNFVESEIRKRPDNYLWSHRRWKWAYNSAEHAGNTLESVE